MADQQPATESHTILRTGIEAIENLLKEKERIDDDIAHRYATLKTQGFDPKVAKQAVMIRAKDQAAVSEAASLLETYLQACR